MKIISKISSDKDKELEKIKLKTMPDTGFFSSDKFEQSILQIESVPWPISKCGPVLYVTSMPYFDFGEKEVYEKALVINTQFCDNYGHILPDSIPDLINAEENDNYDVVFSATSPMQKEIINLIGLKFNKVKFIEEKQYLKARSVTILNKSTYPQLNVSKIRRFKGLIEENISSSENSNTLIYHRRSKKNAQNGRIISEDNEKIIIDLLKEHASNLDLSFCVYDGMVNGERMPIKDQIRLFRSAKMIVGPHGSGFANVIWIDPKNKCKVCEFAWGTEKMNNWVKGQTLGFSKNYNSLYSGCIDDYTDYFLIPFSNKSIGENVEIDIDNLREFLDSN